MTELEARHLEVTRAGLRDLEEIMRGLRENILPTSRTWFAIMAEGWVEDLHKLRGEIDQIIGVTDAEALLALHRDTSAACQTESAEAISAADLEPTRTALTECETALADLKRDVFPIDPARFASEAEPIVADIRALRSRIDQIIGVAEAEALFAAGEPRVVADDAHVEPAPARP